MRPTNAVSAAVRIDRIPSRARRPWPNTLEVAGELSSAGSDAVLVPMLLYHQARVQLEFAVLLQLATFCVPGIVTHRRIQMTIRKSKVAEPVHVLVARLLGEYALGSVIGHDGPMLSPALRDHVLDLELAVFER